MPQLMIYWVNPKVCLEKNLFFLEKVKYLKITLTKKKIIKKKYIVFSFYKNCQNFPLTYLMPYSNINFDRVSKKMSIFQNRTT